MAVVDIRAGSRVANVVFVAVTISTGPAAGVASPEAAVVVSLLPAGAAVVAVSSSEEQPAKREKHITSASIRAVNFFILISLNIIKNYSYKWQATIELPTFLSFGVTSAHFSIAIGHLVLNAQPDGTLSGDGISPSIAAAARVLITRGSGIGIAESNAFV